MKAEQEARRLEAERQAALQEKEKSARVADENQKRQQQMVSFLFLLFLPCHKSPGFFSLRLSSFNVLLVLTVNYRDMLSERPKKYPL